MISNIDSNGSEPAGAKSQTTVAYARVRSDILTGRLAPGERLKIAELAAALSVSPGAIREALSRLVPEQLVVSRDQKGFIVASLSIADLEDLTDLRCEIEALALRRSVAGGDVAWEGLVLASAHRLRRTPMTCDGAMSLRPEWVDRHTAFHAALVGACGSRRLVELHAQLYRQSERYRGLSARIEGGRDVQAEHQALVDAAIDRNADRLVDLAVAHFRHTTALIVEATRRGSTGLVLDEAHPAAVVPYLG